MTRAPDFSPAAKARELAERRVYADLDESFLQNWVDQTLDNIESVARCGGFQLCIIDLPDSDYLCVHPALVQDVCAKAFLDRGFGIDRSASSDSFTVTW